MNGERERLPRVSGRSGIGQANQKLGFANRDGKYFRRNFVTWPVGESLWVGLEPDNPFLMVERLLTVACLLTVLSGASPTYKTLGMKPDKIQTLAKGYLRLGECLRRRA